MENQETKNIDLSEKQTLKTKVIFHTDSFSEIGEIVIEESKEVIFDKNFNFTVCVKLFEENFSKKIGNSEFKKMNLSYYYDEKFIYPVTSYSSVIEGLISEKSEIIDDSILKTQDSLHIYVKRCVHSYHTFIFPFLWNDSVNKTGKTNNREHFAKCMAEGWVPDTASSVADLCDKEFYDQFQYFNNAAKNAIFTSPLEKGAINPADSDIVWNYRFNFGKSDWLESDKTSVNPLVFKIKKYKRDSFSQRNNSQSDYLLRLNGVRLKLFNTGVGMLVYELENYEYPEIDDINKINEFGRRVMMPFVSYNNYFDIETKKRVYDEFHCNLCADEITICDGDKLLAGGKVCNNFETVKDGDTVKKEAKLADFVTYFLTNDVYSITTNKKIAEDKYKFYIEPIIDDRMFVACICINSDFANSVKQWTGCEYRYLSDTVYRPLSAKDNIAAKLYELIFVDGDGLTCQSRTMLRQMLEKHVYPRWIGFGTITGVSEYSLISVTSFAPATVGPFLTEYVEMVILSLAQRASLLAFERSISDVACGKVKTEINEIQNSYVKFQSELLLQEVTPQQQGIELYNMLLDNLFITTQQREIENQIKALYETASAKNEAKENFILFVLALLGLFQFFGISIANLFCDSLLIKCILFGISLIVCIVLLINRKWKIKEKFNSIRNKKSK